MFRFILIIVKNTPIYPHWLDFKNKRKGFNKTLKYFNGKVLETGAGSCEKKDHIIAYSNKVTKYVATDYDSWDSEFEGQRSKINKFGIITQILYGRAKDPDKLDAVCDARKLPYKKASFDVCCNFEVLEHIDDTNSIFKEGARVIKKGGYLIIGSPYLYREHGGVEMDFVRLSRGGYNYYAEKNGLEVIEYIPGGYFGTTLSILTNQFVIRKILEGSMLTRLILFPISPLIFLTFNTVGFIIDSFDKDIRFASGYFVVMKKK